MQGILVPAYAEVAARVFALTAAFHALSNAANYNILLKGQEAYAKMTGKNMASIAKQVQVASKHMLDFKEASTSVALASTSGLASKQIVAMTKAAVDSSSALGRSVQDTMDRLTRGIVKAEPEILDEIGVIIRLDRVYKDYAASVGRSTAELTEGEKATARYNAIMGQLENKFGGIADTLDPNYFAALSATVLDIINKVSSFMVTYISGPLKFLTESKVLLTAIMALILKNLLGKVFPVFTTFGDKISAMPEKMAKKNALLAHSITKLKTQIKGSAAEMEKFQKIAGGTKRKTGGMLAAEKAGDIDKYTRLQKQALQRAQRGLEPGGTVKGGIYKGMNAQALKGVEAQVISLGRTQKRWHEQVDRELTKHKISLKSLQLQYQTAKLGIARFAKQQVELVNMPFLMGIKQIGINWTAAGGRAHWALNTMKVGISTVTVLAKGLATAISKIFRIFMVVTMVVSAIKMVASMFYDFDTPFMKAAEAASTLNKELKTTLENLNERPDNINFDGMAANFNDALKNANFAANLADEIYNATSKAMKHLDKELTNMNWLDKMINWIKETLGLKSLKSSMAEALSSNVTIAQTMGTSLPTGLQDLIDKENLKQAPDIAKARDIINYTEDRNKILNEAGPNKVPAAALTLIEQQKEKIEKITAAILPTVLDQLDEPALQKYLKEFDAINLSVQTSTKDRASSIDELGKAYQKISKYEKEYSMSLVSKTEFYDLALAQQSLQNLLNQSILSEGEKVLGGIAGKFITPGSELADKMKDQKEAVKYMEKLQKGEERGSTPADITKQTALLKRLQSEITALAAKQYLGEDAASYLPADYVQLQQDALKIQTDRLGIEKELKSLKIFGSSAIQEESALSVKLLEQERDIIQGKILGKGLDKEALKNAKEKLRLKNLEIREAGATALAQAQHTARVEGRSLTITERFLAISKDLKDTYTSKELEENGFIKILEKMEGEAIQTFFAKYIESIDKTIKLAREMEDFDKNFSKLSATEQIKVVNAQIKALRFTSYSGNMSAGQMARVLKDSDGMSIATSHRKAMKERSFLDEGQYGEGAYTFRKHKVLIDIAMKVEQIKAKNIKAEEKNLQTKWYIEQELWKAQEAERSAIWKERAATFGAAMTKVADSFGSAIGNYFNDIFMNKKPEKGAFRNTLAKGFASAGSGLIANTVQKQVFGNQGFLAGIAGQFMSPEWVETLFPKTELEMASERTNYLKQIWDKYDKESNIYSGSPLFGSGNNTYGVKGDYGLGGKIANGAGGEVLSQILPMSLVEMAAPFLGLFQGGTGTSTIFNRGQNMLNTKGYSPFSSTATGSSNFVSFMIQELFGGFFANGGTLGAGKFGIAGENGPELIHGPAKITPMGVGGNVTVNVAVDANGQSSVADSSGDGARELGHMVSQAVQSELIEQQRPGGLLSAF